MEVALIDALSKILAVIIGVFLNEHFRSINKVDFYSQKLFEKRFSVYEKLIKLVRNAYEIAIVVIENNNLSKEERHQLVSRC